jgi:hypothetical protein
VVSVRLVATLAVAVAVVRAHGQTIGLPRPNSPIIATDSIQSVELTFAPVDSDLTTLSIVAKVNFRHKQFTFSVDSFTASPLGILTRQVSAYGVLHADSRGDVVNYLDNGSRIRGPLCRLSKCPEVSVRVIQFPRGAFGEGNGRESVKATLTGLVEKAEWKLTDPTLGVSFWYVNRPIARWLRNASGDHIPYYALISGRAALTMLLLGVVAGVLLKQLWWPIAKWLAKKAVEEWRRRQDERHGPTPAIERAKRKWKIPQAATETDGGDAS